jgi:MFS family permease
MLEAYAFIAAFTVQIMAMSVLLPAQFLALIRDQAGRHSIERFAQFYPGVDLTLARERFVSRYRATNAGIALLGFVVLGWLFTYLQGPDWDNGPVKALVGAYFGVQALPLLFITFLSVRFRRKVLKHSAPEGKRKATLQRRGLFDFVSPFAVFLAVFLYFLFAAFVLYLQQHPFPGFAGSLINLGVVTLVFALEAFCIYTMLYGKKINELETNADSVHMIGLGVKCCVYVCILMIVFISLNFALVLLDQQRWEPFAMSVFLTICALLSVKTYTAPPREAEADGSAGHDNAQVLS